MNRYAYSATDGTLPFLKGLAKLRMQVHHPECIPQGSVIFLPNRRTLLETLLVPYQIWQLTGRPVWGVADHPLPDPCVPAGGGALCAAPPERDIDVVKTLLTGERGWVIDPEAVTDGEAGAAPFRTGGSRRAGLCAAALALRTEFYRQRLARLSRAAPQEAADLASLLGIEDLAAVLEGKTAIVPLNLSCYPVRLREELLPLLTELVRDEVPPQRREEVATEVDALLSRVDIDLRFAPPLDPARYLCDPQIQRDIRSPARTGLDQRLPSRAVMRSAALALSERCMAQVHGMTTVNHDHLFASLLRALPFRKTQEDDLRRRVYLVASSLAMKGVLCHRSLQMEQVALLADDRYHKYRNFSLLAAQSRIALHDDGTVLKGGLPLLGGLLPRRLDGPLESAAAEVAFLDLLQREVRRTAWLPRWLVRRKVAQRLERQALEEFEKDYRAFYRPGESKGREVGAPVLLRGRFRALGVVLVHGFLAAPLEVAELARHLQGEGLWVYLVRLKGHGTAPEDLSICSRKEWMDSVDRGYALMKGICREVVLGGFSFGGGVALDCAGRVRHVAGVFAVCPPHRLMDISSRFVPAVHAWNRVMNFLRLHGGKLEYAQIFPERPLINYHRLPICAVLQLELFMRQLEQMLPTITVPALVLQADGDPVVDPRGSRKLFEMLGSPDKEYRLLPRARHGILAGEGAGEAHAEIAEFVKRIARGGRGLDPR